MEKKLYCAEYFLTEDTVSEERAKEISVGDFIITNVGIMKVVSVTDGNIIAVDADIDYATANIIDVRKVGESAKVYGRNPIEVETGDYKAPVEKYNGATVSKKSLDKE